MVVMIILLILCLPLILMLSLFTTTNVVSIVVDVPVTGIEVAIEEIVELDLDKGESFEVDYVITPSEASKKDVKVTFSQIEDKKLATFDVEGNKIIPTSYGSALVTFETVDGGFRDSFEVIVHSKVVEKIESSPLESEIVIGQYTEIHTDYYPSVINDDGLTYSVKAGGEGIITVSKSGKIRGIGIGTATVVVTSADNPDATCEFDITVKSSGVIDFVEDTNYITAVDDVRTGSIQAVLNPEVTVSGHEIKLVDKETGEVLPDSVIEVLFDLTTGLVSYDFKDRNFIGTVEIQLTVNADGGESATKSCYVTQISEITIEWEDQGGDGKYSVFNSSSAGNRIGVNLKPLGANVSYKIKLVFDNKTDVVGEVQSGVEFDLETNEVYTCQGGFVSIELESTSDGVYLVVRGKYAPTMDEIINDFAVTDIYLTVTNKNTGEDTVLAPISVVVY